MIGADRKMNDRISVLKKYMKDRMSHCSLCPRECGADRLGGETGMCGAGAEILAARASLHMWEEPCISGKEGSGTVFFTGCPLGCVYCQNSDISGGAGGIAISEEKLADVFLNLQERGANNINLVTAGHFIPQVGIALCIAKEHGLAIPVVYNSSGYEKVESLRLLEGLIDIWLPDFKYMNPETAAKYSAARDYPETAKAALAEMVRQNEPGIHEGREEKTAEEEQVENQAAKVKVAEDNTIEETLVGGRRTSGELLYDKRGMLKKGVIVRHLLLPGHVKEAEQIVDHLWHTYGDRILLSLMSQYTPMPCMKTDPLLGRTVTKREYGRLLDHVLSLGITDGFFQEGEAARESFIPEFDGRGILDLPE